MKTRMLATIITILLTVSLLEFVSSNQVSANPGVLQVPSQYPTIQAAIDNADSGDTILVAAGTYTENVIVTQSVALQGSGQNEAFIEAFYNNLPVIEVNANNVNISGFTISRGATGIRIDGFNRSRISDNRIISNKYGTSIGDGVWLRNSHDNTIFSNVVSLHPLEGIVLESSSNNLIYDNVVTHGNLSGIGLLDGANSNVVRNNTITFNERGIYPTSSNDTVFTGNTLLNNTIGVSTTLSFGNRFYYNNFVNNTIQVDTLDAVNTWNWTDKGNFWSDYKMRYPSATEIGATGIWNTAYLIDEEPPSQYDYLPLVGTPSPLPQDVTPPVTADDYGGLWHNTDFTINLTAVDDLSGVKETYYMINSGQTSILSTSGQPYFTTESSNQSLEYWSIDNAGNNETHHVLINIKLDKTPPTGSIQINDGGSYTTSIVVTLNLSATDALSQIAQMRFSNDGTTFSADEAYSTSKTWNLTASDGVKRVYVTYLDTALNTQTYNGTILLDIEPPLLSILSPNMGAQINSPNVTVEWNGTDAGLGVDYFELALDADSPINVGTAQTYALSGMSDGDHTVTIRAFDKLGQASEASVNFVVNTTPIGGPGYLEEIVLVILVAVAVVVIIIYFLRVRRKRPSITHTL